MTFQVFDVLNLYDFHACDCVYNIVTSSMFSTVERELQSAFFLRKRDCKLLQEYSSRPTLYQFYFLSDVYTVTSYF